MKLLFLSFRSHRLLMLCLCVLVLFTLPPCLLKDSHRVLQLAHAFPFEFGGAGFEGFNFGGGAPPPRRERKPDVDYYGYLELDAAKARQLTEKEIKSQYRKLSRTYHPDAQGGEESNRERFIQIQRAYEVLSDPKKRKMFDLLGETGLDILEQQEKAKEAGQGADIFASLLSELGAGGAVGSRFKAEDVEIALSVDLADLQQGGSVKHVEYRKNCVCEMCKGRGAPPKAQSHPCRTCGGSGVTVGRVQVGQNMFQQVQQACPKCQGEGRVFTERCHRCGGAGVYVKRVSFPVTIPQGAPEEHVLVFEMEGQESKEKIPGDLRVRLGSAPNKLFQRRPADPQTKEGADLEYHLQITLKEALLGFEKEIIHLNGKEKVVVRKEDGSISPYGTVIKIAGKGLPRFEKAGRGDLHVYLEFQLPAVLTAEQKEAIEAAWSE